MSAPAWRLRYATRASRDLRRLDPQVRRRVGASLERLADRGPERGALTKLKGLPGSRLRVGDWRVIVELDEPSRTIRVRRVLPRGRAYER